MTYTSTRDKSVRVTSSEAITRGISADGGLFVPTNIPRLSADDLLQLSSMDYKGRAKEILSLYLTDFTPDEISACVDGAYAPGKFASDKIAPLVTLSDGVDILELWKGPTCAFKDMALQLLPYLLAVSASKAAQGRRIVILVATSGDTGKAALEGFKDVPDTQIMVFYPNEGVSPMQKLQMATQEGANVAVCAINGNFDDAQNGVKAIFTDKAVAEKLAARNLMFSSANSINWGRLVPQIVYYVSAYCDLIQENKIKNGDKINIVVPTGNFGNILAAYYAGEMGVPLNRLVCASNQNRVLTDFISTGVYDRRRDFYTTMSPSMDILISSNLERLLFLLTGQNDTLVREWMTSLSKDGVYDAGAALLAKMNVLFAGGFCDEAGTSALIKQVFTEKGYLCDTHTAVAVDVYNRYRAETGDETYAVIASTASPFKFCASVLGALDQKAAEGLDEFGMVRALEKLTGQVCPPQLADLNTKKVRFTQCCEQDEMEEAVLQSIAEL
ncbi:MAG: threonine synthase [Oscillospiraceae bacterium]|nr:threonine synthase [Oscillospiraceae bacterium]